MKTKLFIPETIRVGYQNREGTYTKKLAYVIYYDNTGKLRKEISWQSWRDKKIPTDDYENKPTEGFVLNKGVGGARQSYGWNPRNEYIRVYDPRGFEFEISVANLLFILQEATSTRGKGLEGQFVYSWDAKELVLLPVDCNDYKECVNFTGLQSKKIDAKEMQPGCIYKFKNTETAIYLGRLNYQPNIYDNKLKKCHVFYNSEEFTNTKWNHPKNYKTEIGFTKIAEKVTNTPIDNYAEILEKYLDSSHANRCIGIVPVEKTIKSITTRYENREDNYTKINDNFYEISFEKSYRNNGNFYIKINYVVKFENDILSKEWTSNPITQYSSRDYTSDEILKNYKFYTLYALLENKSKIKL